MHQPQYMKQMQLSSQQLKRPIQLVITHLAELHAKGEAILEDGNIKAKVFYDLGADFERSCDFQQKILLYNLTEGRLELVGEDLGSLDRDGTVIDGRFVHHPKTTAKRFV